MALNGAYENKKTRRLARALKMPPWAALGLMEAVWAWARKSARTGRIEADQWEDLADYLQWQQPSDELRDLLIGAQFIDEMGGWDFIHDWHQHADDNLRRQLEYHQEKFANGAETRNWTNKPGRVSSRKVPEKHGVVLEKSEILKPSHGRAGPVPEPVPEPAAAERAGHAPAREDSPPPLSEGERAELAKLLQSAMARGTPPPDRAIVRRVEAEMQGATLQQLAAALVGLKRRRQKPPDSYGFWPGFFADALSPEARARLPAPIHADIEHAPEEAAPTCGSCGGSGVVGRKEAHSADMVRAAIKTGAAICSCERGEFWREYLAMDDVPVIRREARVG